MSAATAPVAGSTKAFRIGLGEATGAVADLGVMVPLATALVLVNGLDAGTMFVCAGVLVLASGVVFRIPFPVQPLKALTAVAVAQGLAPGVIHAAGLELGVFLLVLAIGGIADRVARIFTKPVVRALQFGVGVLLAVAAVKLVLAPPEIFAGTPEAPWPWVLAIATFAGVVFAARSRRYWVALVILLVGCAVVVVAAPPSLAAPGFTLPDPRLPAIEDFGAAFFLLVVPQLPLTFGNAVVAVSDLARDEFGQQAERVTPSRVCRSAGIGNVATALVGGMPMCHGAGGLTAHIRLGARSAGMNLLLGSAFVVLGLAFATQIPILLGLLPIWALAAFLVYAGARHAWLVRDQRGADLAIAVVAGALGAWVGNLAVTAGLALVVVHVRRSLQPHRTRGTEPDHVQAAS